MDTPFTDLRMEKWHTEVPFTDLRMDTGHPCHTLIFAPAYMDVGTEVLQEHKTSAISGGVAQGSAVDGPKDGYRPSMSYPDICSCNIRIPAIHGHKKRPNNSAFFSIADESED